MVKVGPAATGLTFMRPVAAGYSKTKLFGVSAEKAVVHDTVSYITMAATMSESKS